MVEKKSTRRSSTSSSSRSKSRSKKSHTSSSSAIDFDSIVAQVKNWLQDDRRKLVLVVLLMLLMFVQMTGGFRSRSSVDQSASMLRQNAFDQEEEDGLEERVVVKKEKKKKVQMISPEELEAALKSSTGKINKSGQATAATNYNVLLKPLEVNGELVICPDKGGGSQNKKCSQAYAEYLFEVPFPGSYYVYVETVAPNINDNSLWIGAPGLDSNQFSLCPNLKAGPLVPHKHIKSKKWLCCPKYLANNAKKGQGQFYCDCCISTIGPTGKDIGCILDLEVSTKPMWNMLPRQLQVTSSADPVAVRLYAREDGTGFTRVLLSSDADLQSNSIH